MALLKFIKTKIARHAIAIALRKAAPDRFSLSRPRSLKNDFNATYLWKEDAKSAYLIRGINEQAITVTATEEGADQNTINILNDDLIDYNFYNQHYYSGFNINTNSYITYIIRYYMLIDYFSVKNNSLAQILYNKRKITRRQRMKVLSLIVNNTINDRNYHSTTYKIIKELYPPRLVFHPEYHTIINYYELILDSLSADGYLNKHTHSYTLNGKGMAGLIKFETDEQRFTQAMRHNLLLLLLTFGLILTGLIQAYTTYQSSVI